MKIKYLLISVLMLAGIALRGSAQSASDQPTTYFPYPIVPDSISTFQARCNYLADHFWDFCEMSKIGRAHV